MVVVVRVGVVLMRLVSVAKNGHGLTNPLPAWATVLRSISFLFLLLFFDGCGFCVRSTSY